MAKPLKKTAKPPSGVKPKRPSKRKRPAHALITDHLARMAEGPMPDDFGTQLSTYMSKPGPKRSKASDTQPEVPLSDKQRRDIAMKAAKERWSKNRGT
jgi:hypothetical protein